MTLLGSHFPQWGRELWDPIRGAVRQQGLPAVLVELDMAVKLLCHWLPDRAS